MKPLSPIVGRHFVIAQMHVAPPSTKAFTGDSTRQTVLLLTHSCACQCVGRLCASQEYGMVTSSTSTTRNEGRACSKCVGELIYFKNLIKKCTNKSVKRFLRNQTDVGMVYWSIKYTNKGHNTCRHLPKHPYISGCTKSSIYF